MIVILGIPGLSFDVMLMFYQKSDGEIKDEKRSKFPGSLDLYSDPQMEQFFTRGIRGGQSFIAQRYATGNANPEEKGHHLLYVDGKIVLCL